MEELNQVEVFYTGTESGGMKVILDISYKINRIN